MTYRILLIEDDLVHAKLLCGWIREASYEVVHVTTLADALEVNLRDIDIVVCDEQLPDGHGSTYCERVKNGYPDLPVLMVSADSGTTVLLNALRSRADDMLFKFGPLRKQELVDRIEALIARGFDRRSERDAQAAQASQVSGRVVA